MSDSTVHSIDVDPGDPQNDQMAAQSRRELYRHVDSIRATLREANGATSAAMAVAAVALDRDEARMPRIRLASLLAAALVELATRRAYESDDHW